MSDSGKKYILISIPENIFGCHLKGEKVFRKIF
jgi:hypothetical protein